MDENYYIIAGGNKTLLVKEDMKVDRKAFITEHLGEVEQIGFTTTPPPPTLRMMGDELCINALLAFAYALRGSGRMRTTGTTGDIIYRNNGASSEITMQLPYKQIANIVLFAGIGYIISAEEIPSLPDALRQSMMTYQLPAFGAIYYEGNKIQPFVAVAGVNSFVKETACGSGSIAFSMYKNISEVIQPTGERIRVKKNGDSFSVSAEVRNV